jgi:murein hydrolase activator
MRGSRILIFLFLLWAPILSEAQNSKQGLEKKRTQNQRKINETRKILKEVSSKKTVSLGQLSVLAEQIKHQDALISTLNLEIKFLAADIDENELIAESLKKDLEDLKNEYALMIYAASKSSNSFTKLMYIFSSKDFNQFRRRLKYMEQYSKARKAQIKEIEYVQTEIDAQIQILMRAKREKQDLVNSERNEKEEIKRLKRKQTDLVGKLNKREKVLKKELAKRKKDDKRLAKLIKDLIAKEVHKGRKTAPLTPEAAELAASFERNKRKLPWPVQSGFVSQKFGKNPHPVLRGVFTENDGVDIQTNKGEKVRSVFEGTVLTVAVIPGNNNAVMIRHGNFISVYAGIKNVNVKKGQKVMTKEALGEVYTDKNGVSQFQFQIWKGFDKMNPEFWLFGR